MAWGLLVAIAALVFGGYFLRSTAPQPAPVGAAGDAAGVLLVRTVRVAPSHAAERVVVPGVLEPRRRVRLASETSGRVTEVGAEELDRVEADQLLVRVDPLTARIALERAEAALARTESEFGLAKTSLGRQRSLKERAVASDSALDDATNRSRVAEAAIREASANLEEARDDLAKKTIRAPFAGALRSFEVELGEYVREGQQLGELLDLSTARLVVGLPDRQVVAMRQGATVAVEVEAWPNERFEGVILRVGDAADEDTKKFPVEIELDNASGRLRPGMVARAVIQVPAPRPRLLVPREAVGAEYGLRFVFVVDDGADGRARARRRRVEVRELPFEPALLELVSGVREGEEIAADSVQLLRDGAAVRRASAPGAGQPPETS